MDLQSFMLQEEDLNKVVERICSKRYKEAFKFKSVDAKTDAELKAKCTVKKVGLKGKQDVEFLASKYQNLLIMESLVHPDLNNKQLQDFYGVMGAEALFNKMFNPGEIAEMFIGAQEANGYDLTFDEMVEEAKN